MEIAEIKITYSNTNNDDTKITSSYSAYQLFKNHWDNEVMELQEEFKVLILNRANKVLGVYNHTKGGTSETTVDVKLVFSVAIKCNASGIIVGHNHPSGNLKASNADIAITKRLKQAGETLGIALLDHLIITKKGYFSFADEGCL